ncbi:MAG: TonB-dependent receptor [Gemmatimonadaceae bacterium]|nr:TonB-dependent receptor [Gemmatimonadaceae bacterium]
MRARHPVFVGRRPAGRKRAGRVSDARTHEGVGFAHVVLRDDQGRVAAGVAADADGVYALTHVPAGRYALEASRIGYATANVPVVQVVSDQTLTLDLSLALLAAKADVIVVSGSRRLERAADSDVSASVIPAEQIQRRAESTVFGALRQVPGLDFFSTGLGQQQPNARGWPNAFATNMLFLIDGRLATLPGLGTTLPGMVPVTQNDVAQIEVITGAASALYGANAAQGVINVVTKDPRQYPGQSVSMAFGDRTSARIDARLAGMLGQQFGYKISAESFQANDFTTRIKIAGLVAPDSAYDDPEPQVSTLSTGATFYWYPRTGRSVAFSTGLQESNYINVSVAGRIQVKGWRNHYQQLRAQLGNVLGGSLFVQGNYTANDAGDSYYLDNMARGKQQQPGSQPPLTYNRAMAGALFVDRGDRFDAEAQYTAHVGSRHFFTAGAMSRVARPYSGGTYLTDSVNSAGTDAPVRIRETGAYLGYDNLSIHNVRLTVVGRYDSHSDLESRVSPKASLSFTLPRGNVLRVSYNQAFNSPNTYLLYARSPIGRAGTLPLVIRGNRLGWQFTAPTSGAVTAALEPLRPLEVRSVEVGWRGTPHRTVTTDVTVYASTFTNYISRQTRINDPARGIFAIDPLTQRPLTEITFSYTNYGRLPVQGADLQLEWTPNARWQTTASASYQMPGAFQRALTGLDEPQINAPAHKYKGAVQWREWWRAGSALELSAISVSKFFFQSTPAYLQGIVPTYTVVDLNVSAPIPRRILRADTRAQLNVFNAFNNRHIELPGGATMGRWVRASVGVSW